MLHYPAARSFGSVAVLVLLLVPSVIALACSRAQTEAYLAEGTDHVFTQKRVDYVIMIDRSGSMAGAKLDTVRRAAHSLIDKLGPEDRAAIISFNYEARLDQPLTTDHDALFAALDGISASFGTQYAPAMRLSQRQLSESTNDRALIFLSDGKDDFAETPTEINTLTTAIARQGACIMTISYALGGEESEQLRAMAELGKSAGCGEHYIASEKGTELEQVFSAIRDRLTSTDVIKMTPSFSNGAYAFTYMSTLNNNSLPGSNAVGCAEEPAIHVEITKAGRTYAVLNETNGSLILPSGTYTYNARSSVRCDGTCSFAGVRDGVFTVGDGCAPSYAQLATYVTGASHVIHITKTGFEPKTISAQQGTTLLWNNTDTVSHTITSPYFNATIPPNGLFAYRVQNVGSFLFADPETNNSAAIQTITAPGSDVMLVIDESGSMNGAPLDEARRAAQQFYATLAPGDRAGLITFSQSAHLEQDLTSDKTALLDATSTLRSEGATAYLSALNVVESLRPVQHPILVFMSDGEPTDTTGTAQIDAAMARIRAKGWCVMTIGFGSGGAQARAILARMAGTDACASFLYAADGELSTTFGTVYQLLAQSSDLTFTKLSVSPIVFGNTVTITTHMSSKSGAPVPGGAEICSPEAAVQASSTLSSTNLIHANGTYTGKLTVPYGRSTVSLTASVTSPEEPSQPFVGHTSATVIAIPGTIGWSIVAAFILFGGFVAYTLRKKLSRETAPPVATNEKTGGRP